MPFRYRGKLAPPEQAHSCRPPGRSSRHAGPAPRCGIGNHLNSPYLFTDRLYTRSVFMILSVSARRVSGSAPSGGTGHGREPWKALAALGSSSLPLPARSLPRYPLTNLLSRIHLIVGSRLCPMHRKKGGSSRPPFSFLSLGHWLFIESSMPSIPSPLRTHAKLESGARNACVPAGFRAAALVLRDSRQAEIPLSRAANSSAHDSPRAAAPLPLRATRRSGCSTIFE